MKPYGREKKVKGLPSKKDGHPPKGEKNWWETICDYFSRSRMKHDLKKEIRKELSNGTD